MDRLTQRNKQDQMLPNLKNKLLAIKSFRKKQNKYVNSYKENELNHQQKELTLLLEMELYKSVFTLLILSEVFICAPTFAHRRALKGNRQERILQYCHAFWFLTVYVILSSCIYTEYTQSNIDLPTVQKPLYFCEYLVYLIHIFQIIAGTLFGRRNYKKFINVIVNFDQCLMEFDVYPQYHLLTKFLKIHILLILTHFIITCVVDYFYSDCLLLNFFRSSTIYTLPNIILEVSLVQYYGLLYAIAIRSIHLNNILKRKLSKEKQNPLALQENLHKIRLLYSKLQLFTKNINDAFGQSIVLVYIGSFMNITVNIFLIYKFLDKIASPDLAWIMYSVIWTFMHIGKMFLILYYNYSVQNQSNTTSLLLNDVKGQNPEIEETITHFIFQLIINTRSNVVCGVAVLNMEFITSLLVTISTLFIFLLQYDITYEALTNTHNSGSPIRT